MNYSDAVKPHSANKDIKRNKRQPENAPTRFQAASYLVLHYFRCPALNRFSSQEKNVDKQIVIAKYTNATVYSGSS